MADTNGPGYENGALVFGAGLVIIAAAYYFTYRRNMRDDGVREKANFACRPNMICAFKRLREK